MKNYAWLPIFLCIPLTVFSANDILKPRPNLYWDVIRNDLAYTPVGKGASLIAFKQNSAGNVAGPALEKSTEKVSVRDFGAIGDGIADDAPAINRAIASGAKYIEFPAPLVQYKLGSPINLTNLRGVTLKALGNVDVNIPMFLIAHYGVGFDLTGSFDCVLDSIGGEGDATITPKALFLLARNNTNASAGRHRFFNIHSNGSFAIASLYAYGSEENDFYSPWLLNKKAGGGAVVLTSSNIAGLTSSFTNIAHGNQSNVGYHFFGGSYLVTGNGGSKRENTFYFDSAGDVSILDPFMYCPFCQSHIYVDGSKGASDIVSISGMRGEVNVTKPLYGVYFGNEAVRGTTNWTIQNSRIDATNEAVFVSDKVTLGSLDYSNITITSGKAIDAKNLVDSTIFHGSSSVNGRASGTIMRNLFVGYSSNVTLLGADTTNTLVDTNGGYVKANGFRFPSTQVPSSDQNTLDDYKEGNWPCAFAFSSPGNLSITYESKICTYTKIGRQVTVTGYIATSTFIHSTALGMAYIDGLPFSGNAGITQIVPIPFYRGFGSMGFTSLSGQVNTNRIFLYKSGSALVPTITTTSDWLSGGTINLSFVFSYFI